MAELLGNGTQRHEGLKKVIRQLHDGKKVEDVKIQFEAIIKGVTASELAQIENEIIKSTHLPAGLPGVCLKRFSMCTDSCQLACPLG